jgi:hypothetical protein
MKFPLGPWTIHSGRRMRAIEREANAAIGKLLPPNPRISEFSPKFDAIMRHCDARKEAEWARDAARKASR